MKTVGLVGLGVMGVFCAKTLIQNGFDVVGYDPFAAAAQRAADVGVQLAASPSEVAAKTEWILLFVPAAAETEQVIMGDNGLFHGLQANSIILNMSTVEPAINVRMAEAVREKQVGFIDAPVLGSPSGVGSWAIVLGGSDADIEAVKPLLCLLSGSEERLFHLGVVGSGNALKLLNNMMLGAINACAAEVMALANHIGISQKMLIDVAVAANARALSNAYKEIGGRIAEERYDDPTFTLDMLIKDNHLCLEMAKACKAPMVLGSAVDYVHRMAEAQGYGQQDHSVAWKSIAKNWK